jgi:nucleotide-binding universal stress UspA family protein
MIPVRSILAATDLTPSGDLVIRTAADLATAFDATLHVVHVAAPWDERGVHGAALDAQVERSLRAHRTRLFPALDVDTAVMYDRPFHGILVHAATVSVDLIVVGAHRRVQTAARWSGTTAERIVRSADVPCLVVNRPLSLPLRHAGVTVDFSPAARGAALLAADWLPRLAESGEAPTVSLVHVAPNVKPASDAEAMMAVEIDRLQGADTDVAWADVRLKAVLRAGTDAVGEVVRWADDTRADLLVVPTEARRGVHRLWAGSQATALATQTTCPVLLVPPALWRRSPIPLARVAAAIDAKGDARHLRAWVECCVDDVPRSVELVHLDPSSDVSRRARDVSADLLVVNDPVFETHRDGARRASRPVPVAPEVVALLERTPIPVLVLRDLPEGALRRILVAVDTGDIWYEKFGWAKLLSDHFDADVTIFHAISLSPTSRVRREPGGELVLAMSVWMRDSIEEAVVPAMESWMWERARIAGLNADRVDVVLGVQDPWYAIPTLAEKTRADLVIVAAHAEGRLGRVPLSRVARAVLEGGSYSVLVVVDRAKREAEWSDAARRTVQGTPEPA